MLGAESVAVAHRSLGGSMRVAFDNQIFEMVRYGGISRYFAELFREFSSMDSSLIVPVTSRPFAMNVPSAEVGLTRRLPCDVSPKIRGSGSLERLAGQSLNALLRNRMPPADVIHETWYRRDTRRERDSTPRVVTVFDMIPEQLDKSPNLSNRRYDKEGAVAQADLVICISHAAKTDLLDTYGRPNAPIHVTPLGVRFGRYAAMWTSSGDRKTIGYVGRRDSYKDFTTLLWALAQLPAGWTVLCAGGGKFTLEEAREVEHLGLTGRVNYVGDLEHQIDWVYSRSRVMVSTSLAEGFGLTTLEAMASGRPAIVSDIPVNREVGGSAARYFLPGDDTHLATVILEMASESARRHTAIEEGKSRAKEYSWRATALATLRAYSSISGLRNEK